nr:MAG TPA: hypothetical protein [Caudoviricetes sp.]
MPLSFLLQSYGDKFLVGILRQKAYLTTPSASIYKPF